jgi:hypothetical protein
VTVTVTVTVTVAVYWKRTGLCQYGVATSKYWYEPHVQIIRSISEPLIRLR